MGTNVILQAGIGPNQPRTGKNREKCRECLPLNSSVIDFCQKLQNCGKDQGISREFVDFLSSRCNSVTYSHFGKIRKISREISRDFSPC
jgi:hypothetical protein